MKNKSGLHARPASEFVRTAAKYKSAIRICRAEKPDRSANAKSMVLLLSLAVMKGTEVTLHAVGEDEQEAVDALVALIETGFGEE